MVDDTIPPHNPKQELIDREIRLHGVAYVYDGFLLDPAKMVVHRAPESKENDQ